MSLRYPDITIEVDGSLWIVEKIYVTELNHLMLRLFNEDEKRYLTYNVGQYNVKDNFISNELRRIQSLNGN